MRNSIRFMAAGALALSLAACGQADPLPAVTVTTTATATVAAPAVTVTATVTASPTPATDPTPEPSESSAAFTERDRTEDFLAANKRQPWAGKVVKVTQTGPKKVTVETTIVDPRGRDGSPQAADARAVCKAAVALLAAEGVTSPGVSVYERDGSTFVIIGSPTWPTCTEV